MMTKKCASCGEEFRVKPSSKQKSCSRACAGRSRRRSIVKNCLGCGEQFETRWDRQKYCSRLCARPAHGTNRKPLGTKRILNGYVQVKAENGWQLEHRLVLAEKLGRELLPWPQETVHHKNGNTQDNRKSNLQLRIGNHGPGSDSKHCSTCTCFKL